MNKIKIALLVLSLLLTSCAPGFRSQEITGSAVPITASSSSAPAKRAYSTCRFANTFNSIAASGSDSELNADLSSVFNFQGSSGF